MRCNLRLLRTLALFSTLLALFIIPWRGRVNGAALLTDSRRTLLYAPMGAIVEEAKTANGLEVEKGDTLLRLRSPDLDSRIEIATKKIQSQRDRLSMASLNLELRVELVSEWDMLERLAEDLAGLLRERSTLTLNAPFRGRLVDVPEWLVAGSWVQAKEPLASLAGGEREVLVFIAEHDRDRVVIGGKGMFYPSGRGQQPVPLTVAMVENQATTEIFYPELSSVYGGPLGTHRNSSGALEPDKAVYRVVCTIEGESLPQMSAGEVSLEAVPQSLADDIWRRFLGLLVRESGW